MFLMMPDPVDKVLTFPLGHLPPKQPYMAAPEVENGWKIEHFGIQSNYVSNFCSEQVGGYSTAIHRLSRTPSSTEYRPATNHDRMVSNSIWRPPNRK